MLNEWSDRLPKESQHPPLWERITLFLLGALALIINGVLFFQLGELVWAAMHVLIRHLAA